jgi:hypothetical protein
VRGEKNGRTYEYSYKYADLADILGMALPILSAQGIAFSQPLRRKEGKLFIVTRLVCGAEVQEDDGIELPTQVKPQEFGTYLSYYRRYSASTSLGISSDEDVDGPSEESKTIIDNKKSGTEQPKRGRPANPAPQQAEYTNSVPQPYETVTAKAPAVQTETNAAGIVPTDADVPSNISSKPTKEEKAAFLKQIADLGVDYHIPAFKALVQKITGKSSGLTKQEWQDVIAKIPENKDSLK